MVTCLAQICDSSVSLLWMTASLIGLLWFSQRFGKIIEKFTTNSVESVRNHRHINMVHFLFSLMLSKVMGSLRCCDWMRDGVVHEPKDRVM
jgi:hypothetical protein